MPQLRLVLSAVLGIGAFVLPIPIDGRWTIAFDVLVTGLQTRAPGFVTVWCLTLLAGGALASLIPLRGEGPRWALFRAGPVLTAIRVTGLAIAVLVLGGLGPSWLTGPAVGGFLWSKLVTAVGILVPIGAMALNLVAGYGLLELVGTWMRPLMRPVFHLPGRAALDDLMSWLGSYSVGLYLTHQLFTDGTYTRRETFIVVTGFSTVSIGFVGVVASTLDLLDLFPLIFATYFVAVYALAAIQARISPAAGVPDVVISPVAGVPDVVIDTGDRKRAAATGTSIWHEGWQRALERAERAPPLLNLAGRGLVDGTLLAATLLGTILTVGSLATALAEHTPAFALLGRPLVPALQILGLPDAEQIAPAILAGITEMYVPALLVEGASAPARFFVCVLSISQLIFFSSVGPMMLDLFKDVPIRVRDLLLIFLLRTVILVPTLALWTLCLTSIGVFEGR